MHQYLTQHQYSNTFTEDLWRSLSEASGKPIEDIMTTWTKQMGFPVLKVLSVIVGLVVSVRYFLCLMHKTLLIFTVRLRVM